MKKRSGSIRELDMFAIAFHPMARQDAYDPQEGSAPLAPDEFAEALRNWKQTIGQDV
jgi:hypothetical protein